MFCKKCKKSMTEQKRVFHGKRKWICPRCGFVRMIPCKTRRNLSVKKFRGHKLLPEDS